MNRSEAAGFLRWWNESCESVMEDRGPRYETNGDILSNFKNGEDQFLDRWQRWFVYAEKHWIAIRNRMERLSNDEVQDAPIGDDIYGNLRDLRNYLDLGACLLHEWTEKK